MKSWSKIKGYEMRKQQRGKFKIIEYSQATPNSELRKRTIRKDLNMSEAEAVLYELEHKLKLQ